MPLTPRIVAALAAPLAGVAVLTGCADEDAGAATEQSANLTEAPVETPAASPTQATPSAAAPQGEAPTVTSNGVTVTGPANGQPVVTVTREAPAPAELVAVDITTGTGGELEAGGAGLFEYEGVLFSDGTTFDSSWDRGSPISMTLQRVIPGWSEGLVGMREGGRRLLIIPPDLAYGTRALPGIPPNSTLVFVVDLMEVTQ